MKRLSICITALAAAIALAGCQKQAPVELPSTYEFELRATAGDPATKTYYEDNMTFKWTEGDKISVLFNNGSDNKFFTLTATTINGASAVFSGSITTGYVLGASDTGDKWALYPASDHSYVGGDYPINFAVPPVLNLSGKALSCNLPMAAISADGATFEFQPAAGSFKFSFTGIKCSKVKFVVQQQVKARRLSGLFPMKKGGYIAYWEPQWEDLGTPGGSLTVIEDVVNGCAEFFIPFAPWDNNFQPIITLTDADTDDLLYTATAKAPFSGDMGSLLARMVVVPDIPVTSVTPWSFPSEYGIDWNSVTNSVAGDAEAGYDALVSMKGTADASNLYIYLEVKKASLISDPSYGHSGHNYFYFGNGTGESTYWPWAAPYIDRFQGWLLYKNGPRYLSYDISGFAQKAVEHNDLYVYEIAFSRASSSFTTLSGSSVTVCMNTDGIYTDASDQWVGSWDAAGFAPARWTDALTVALP